MLGGHAPEVGILNKDTPMQQTQSSKHEPLNPGLVLNTREPWGAGL